MANVAHWCVLKKTKQVNFTNTASVKTKPAPREKEAWNADALMEGVRAGTGRGDFLAALEDRVRAEETQWAPLLQLHFPDLLDDYLDGVLVETGQRFFKKEPMDAPGCADLAARKRELLTHRLEARKDIGEELQQRVRVAEEQLARTSAALKAIRCRLRRRRQSFHEEELRLAWKRREMESFAGWPSLGAKKRDYRALSAALSSRKAWQDEWTKPGAEGGMEASVRENWSEWRAQTRDLVKRSEIKAEVVHFLFLVQVLNFFPKFQAFPLQYNQQTQMLLPSRHTGD